MTLCLDAFLLALFLAMFLKRYFIFKECDIFGT